MSAQALANVYGLGRKTALVTGGGSGLGLAIARSLATAGAKVVIAGRREDVLKAACDRTDGIVGYAVLDLSDTESIPAAVRSVTESFGPIDILVNNAGNTVKKPFADSDIADFDAVFDVHVRGALELTRSLLPGLTASGEGSVTFISSMTAYIGQPNVLGYTVAKTAIGGVIRGLAAELSVSGLRINGVAPGWVDTDLYRKATAGDVARQQKILSRIPMNKLGEPEDIGWACAYLSSRAAKYITGHVLIVDGGGATGF